MKAKLFSIVAIIALATVAVFIFNDHNATASRNIVSPPTPAPTATPGEPVFSWGPTDVPLAQPLLTEEQALEQALRIGMAVWVHPWSLDTLKSEPGRITIKSFPSRTAEVVDRYGSGEFAKELDARAGVVWRITIKGEVQVSMFGIGADPTATFDGVTYVISSITGNLLSVTTGERIPTTETSPLAPTVAPPPLVTPLSAYPASGVGPAPVSTSLPAYP